MIQNSLATPRIYSAQWHRGEVTAEDDGGETLRKTNHEIDAIVRRVTTSEMTPEGAYTTANFLDAALAKTVNELAQRSLENPPSSLSGTAAGDF